MRAVQPLPRRHSRGEARKAVRGLRPGDLQRPGEPAPADALLRGGDCPAVWDAAVARQQAYAPAGVAPITLPRFDPQPEVLRVRFPAMGLPELAEAMLDERILQESDWTGDVRASLTAGVSRWVSELLDGESLRHVRLSLVWNNSIPETLDVDLWAQANPWHSKEHPVGLLAIRNSKPAPELFVGEKTLALEALRPGLGYTVYGTVCDALPLLIGASTPVYGLNEVAKYEAMARMGIPSGALAGTPGVTVAEYLEIVPEAACGGEVRPGVLKQALRDGLPAWARELVQLAVDVHAARSVSRETYACDAHLLHRSKHFAYAFTPGFAPKWGTLVLRWSPEDHVGHVADLYVRELELVEAKNPGTVSNLAWCRAWQPHHPRELRRAVRHWKNAVTIALRGCRLAELLHTENPHA